MPKIQSVNTMEITPEKFLNACDSTELHEVELLLSSPKYRDKMEKWDSGEPDYEIVELYEKSGLPIAGPIPKDLLEQYDKKRTCHQCGCTDDDCRQCIIKTGEPCHWVAEDLCSACAENANPSK